MKRNIGFILSGGVGSRFGSDKPKQYYNLLGYEVISYSINAFRNSRLLDDFFVVVDEEGINAKHIEKKYGLRTINGGKTRNWSFKNALLYIEENFPNCEKIIENNSACPMITSEIVDEFLSILNEYDYVNATYRITDALGSYKNRIANRDDFYLIQSPDAYRFEIINRWFEPDSLLGHPGHMLPLECKEFRYFGFDNNIKITYPEDILKAEYFLKQRK